MHCADYGLSASFCLKEDLMRILFMSIKALSHALTSEHSLEHMVRMLLFTATDVCIAYCKLFYSASLTMPI